MSRSTLHSLAGASGLDIRAEDIEQAIARRNPMASRARIAQVVDLIGQMADMTTAFAKLSSATATETQVGTGLGERLDLEEGMRRLTVFATPMAIEDWAGPCAKPSELADHYGIARSTLDEWRRADTAIGLLAGVRKHVFPLAQFVDGRPVAGLAEVTAIVGDQRSAWLWLVEPRRGRQTQLECLRRGRLAEVLAAAREDFA